MKTINEYMQKEKNRIVDGIILVFGLFIFIPVSASVSRAISIGFKPVMFVQIFLVITAFMMYMFRERISYLVRASWIIGSIMFTGTMGVFQFGVVGNGMTWVIIGPILGTLLFSIKIGIILEIIGFLGIVTMGILTIYLKRVPEFNLQTYVLSYNTWADFIFSFSFVSCILVVAVAKLNKGFYEAIGIAHQHTKEVEEMIDKRTNELAEMNKTLVKISREDFLTQVLNRRAFFEEIEKTYIESKKRKFPCCILMLDVDYLKKVNDTNGHFAGDKVLISISEILKQETKELDIIGRLGGDEFSIFLVDTELTEAKIIAENIRSTVEALKLSFEGNDINITVSIGVTGEHELLNTTFLLRQGDRALYMAKKKGRNRSEIIDFMVKS